MHIVSTVVGELRDDRTAFDALAATFPAGTLSGAPKVRAMEIIEELEPTRRGLYGGIVGYFGFGGDLDTAIAIRTALIRDGVAYVQAGGGHRGRLRPGRRGAGDPQQGRRRAGRDRRRRDPAHRPGERHRRPAGAQTRPARRARLRRRGRRELTYAVLLCLAGAGLALCAATRTWSVELRRRRRCRRRGTRTGGGPAAVAAGAGAGGAGRRRGGAGHPGRLRRLLGGLLALLGLAVAAGGGYGLVADRRRQAHRQWPALCLLGGAGGRRGC